jgi:hypothetical protein
MLGLGRTVNERIDNFMVVRWRPVRFAVFLCVAWLLGSIAITAIIVMKAAGTPAAPYVYAVWAILFIAGTYFVVSLAVNRTTVDVASGRLRARSGPLPFARACSADVRSIGDIVVGSYASAGFMGGRGGRIYTVSARTHDGTTVPLVTWAIIGAGEESDARNLARRIEAMLWKAAS